MILTFRRWKDILTFIGKAKNRKLTITVKYIIYNNIFRVRQNVGINIIFLCENTLVHKYITA